MSQNYGLHQRASTDRSGHQLRSLNICLPTASISSTLTDPSPAYSSPKMSTFSQASPRAEPSGFETHILNMLSMISEAPSPSYPFPSSSTPATLPLKSYAGRKTTSEEAIERGILALGERLAQAETPLHSIPSSTDIPSLRQPSPSPASTQLLTPEWTPPSEAPATCSSCSRRIDPDGTPTARGGRFPESVGAGQGVGSTSLPSALPSATSGGWAGDSGMSAEKELELLKAQVQDIARVCKVSTVATAHRSLQTFARQY
jgi:osomolarity two-component system sensor histidine kinase NIK1